MVEPAPEPIESELPCCIMGRTMARHDLGTSCLSASMDTKSSVLGSIGAASITRRIIRAASGQASDETEDILSQSVVMADEPLRLVAAGLRPAAKADASKARYAAADCGGAGKP